MTEPQDDKPRLKLNAPRLLAGTLAAVTAAALSSRLGVAGTLAGTGMVSLISGAAATVYEHSVERGRVAVRKALDEFTPARPLADEPAEQTRSPHIRSGSGRRWALAGAGAIATFGLAVGIVTGIEAADGKALSGSGHRTTLGAAFGSSHHSTTNPNPNRQPATKPSTHSTGRPSSSPSTTAPSSPSDSPSTSNSPTAPKSSTPKSTEPTSKAPTSTTPPTTHTSQTPDPTPTQAPSSP